MTTPESGGDGYSKIKKSCQTGGASGWSRHCGSTDDHERSNRLERRSAKQELNGAHSGGSKPKRRSDKKPTRRHLLDKLKHTDAQIAKRKQERDAHTALAGPTCTCFSFCSDRWLDKHYAANRVKIIAEFTKHGYKAP
jgi:hypothetical protein